MSNLNFRVLCCMFNAFCAGASLLLLLGSMDIKLLIPFVACMLGCIGMFISIVEDIEILENK